MTNSIVATQVNGVNVVDSRLIAQSIGIAHNALVQNILNHREVIERDFSELQFEIETVVSRSGALNSTRFCLLTEDQSYFVLTLSRNSKEVVEAKAALVKAFSKLRQQQSIVQNTETDEMLMARALQASARLLEASQLEVQQLKPKAILADEFIERDGLVLIGDFAKDLGCIGRNDLFQLLRDKKVIYRLKDKSHQPYQRFVDSGFFVLKPAGVSIGGKERFTCCLTPAGVQWLNEQLKTWLTK